MSQGADAESLNLDEAGVKKILLGFEKKVSRNQEMRIKFPDQPDKFMMSEMELHDSVRELQVIVLLFVPVNNTLCYTVGPNLNDP